jgi:hypothetical protein
VCVDELEEQIELFFKTIGAPVIPTSFSLFHFTQLKALQEYDSDECGSLDDPDVDETLQVRNICDLNHPFFLKIYNTCNFCFVLFFSPKLKGQLAIDNDDVSKLMDEFLHIHEQDRKFHSKTKKETILSKNEQISKLLNQNGLDVTDLAADAQVCGEGGVPQVMEAEEEYAEDEDSGDEDYMPEYLKPKQVSEFDCESIVSTYSNIENHPVRITEKNNKKKKKQRQGGSEDGDDSSVVSKNYGAKVITISAKTGLPVVQEKKNARGGRGGNMHDDDDDDDDDDEGGDSVVNKGVGRNKQETKEEKRLRKLQVKEERRLSRTVKTKLKTAYKEDEKLQMKTASASNGLSMFKY